MVYTYEDNPIEYLSQSENNDYTWQDNYQQWQDDNIEQNSNNSWIYPEDEIESEIDNLWGIWTIAYNYSEEEINQLYEENIKVKQVIAGQPITSGGSRCTWECDSENHHVHTYCKLCKRNLPYGIVQHDCIFGLAPGQIYLDMNPDYLYNEVWWEVEEEILYKGKGKVK